MEHSRRIRNVLLKYMTLLRGTPQQNHLDIGGRDEKMRGYALCKQQDNRNENDAHVKE
jgi:hypothetical protein